MRIHFVRSGGFAGLLVDFEVDTADLPAEEAAALHQAVENAGFFNLPCKIDAAGDEVDRFQYTITVEDEGQKHTVETGEAAMPDSLQPLARQLELLWRARR
jgi:hypothetical protein